MINVPEFVDGKKLNVAVAQLLLENNLKISVAESLTGGEVAAKLVDVPGISKSFIEGIVAYANEAKMNRLSVSAETLIKYGAVSEETAKEMAEGLIKGDVTVSVSTTGIAGPTGGFIYGFVLSALLGSLVRRAICGCGGAGGAPRAGARQLAGDNALQTESGGGNPFKTIHLFPPETIDRVF